MLIARILLLIFLLPSNVIADPLCSLLAPIGLTKDRMETLVTSITQAAIWEKAEAIVVGGSRTQREIGYGPDPDSNFTDLDISVFPLNDYNGDVDGIYWGRDLGIFTNSMQETFYKPYLKIDVFSAQIAWTKSLTTRLKNKEIVPKETQKKIWASIALLNHQDLNKEYWKGSKLSSELRFEVPQRQMQKFLFNLMLQEQTKPYIPLLNYENLIFIRNRGEKTKELVGLLKEVGFSQIHIFD